MKKSLLTKLVLATILAVNLSGCIIVPGWDHHGHGHHHGEFRHGHHGDHHDGHGGGHGGGKDD